jgi:hypothetical protein
MIHDVAPIIGGVASSNRGDHSAGDNRSDAWDAHEPFASRTPFGEFPDLA